MPLKFEIDRERGIVLTSAEGEVTAADLAAHARALVAVPDRPPRELVDFSGQREIPVDMEAVRSAARTLHDEDANKPGGKVAMVADADVVYGTLRLFAAHRDHEAIEIGVFRELDEALEWLGVEPG